MHNIFSGFQLLDMCNTNIGYHRVIGCAICTKRSISPNSLIPISITAAVCSFQTETWLEAIQSDCWNCLLVCITFFQLTVPKQSFLVYWFFQHSRYTYHRNLKLVAISSGNSLQRILCLLHINPTMGRIAP